MNLRRAIVLTVPEPACTLIDEIRERWDPVMRARIGAHVTLVHDVVDPGRAGQLVTALAAETSPFRFRLTRTDRWGPSAYGIYLHVEDPSGVITSMQAQLASVESPAWSRVPFRAHCTLVHGRTVDVAVAEAAWAALDGVDVGLDVEIAAIDVIELEEPAWRAVTRHDLGIAAIVD